MSNLYTTIITPDIHCTPGLGVISYTYDRNASTMCITIDSKGFRRIEGEEARMLFEAVSGYSLGNDPYLIELDKRCFDAWKVRLDDLKDKTRRREILEYRQIVMWWLLANTPKSSTEIGYLLGGFDHATVLHARRTVNDLILTNSDFKTKVEQFLKAI